MSIVAANRKYTIFGFLI